MAKRPASRFTRSQPELEPAKTPTRKPAPEPDASVRAEKSSGATVDDVVVGRSVHDEPSVDDRADVSGEATVVSHTDRGSIHAPDAPDPLDVVSEAGSRLGDAATDAVGGAAETVGADVASVREPAEASREAIVASAEAIGQSAASIGEPAIRTTVATGEVVIGGAEVVAEGVGVAAGAAHEGVVLAVEATLDRRRRAVPVLWSERPR